MPYEVKFSPFTLAGTKPVEYVDEIYRNLKLRAYELGMDFFYRRTYVKPLGCGGASYTLQIDVEGNVSRVLGIQKIHHLVYLEKPLGLNKPYGVI